MEIDDDCEPPVAAAKKKKGKPSAGSAGTASSNSASSSTPSAGSAGTGAAKGKRKVKGIRYNMRVFLEQCIERYQKAAPDHPLDKVDTPFIDEDVGVTNPSRTEQPGPGLVCPNCTEADPMNFTP